jgi:lipid II:glycine glycyltransferase (peptidoglycan interpeptide bridge formation enzyme)
MVVRFGARAVYLFGGSSGGHSNLQPTYALQWTAMQDAWEAGCTVYDLWGVPPSDDPAHPWHGLWQFKMGFRGRLTTYCGAWEYAVRPVRASVAMRLESARSRLHR